MKRPSIGWYAKKILQKPLYPYQQEVGNAILDSVLNHRGLTFTVMMSRQSGKNQISAVIEAYILSCMEAGQIIKVAPTFKPQVINSRLRLLSMLENPLTSNRYWKSFGYMIGVSPTPQQRKDQLGPRIMFFSANPDSSIVGATASLLLEIDEAQDVSIQKFDRDLKPMASSTNATTILYGTAWTDDTLLAIMREHNLALERKDGIKRHFEYDWRTLAAINPNYKAFVEAEIQRLGEEHVSIRTQYWLLPISGAGFLLNNLQRHLLRGNHHWEWEANEFDGYYITSMDVGGEERPKMGEDAKTRPHDSTVITIARVSYNELMLPKLEIVHQIEWKAKHYLEQYAETVELCEMWGIRRIVVDSTWLGEIMGSLLETKLGEERVTLFKFSRQSKSKLTYQFLGMINSGRLKMYHPENAPREIYAECWKQLKLARYSVPGEGLLSMEVLSEDGHDDYLISVALCTEAIRDFSMPPTESQIVRPRKFYQDESRF